MSEYVKRDDVLSYVHEIRPCKSDYFYIGITEEKVLDKQAEIADELEKLPFVEVEDNSERGIWIHKYPYEYIFVCSNCDKTAVAEYDYCPNCGLRMTKCLKN